MLHAVTPYALALVTVKLFYVPYASSYNRFQTRHICEYIRNMASDVEAAHRK